MVRGSRAFRRGKRLDASSPFFEGTLKGESGGSIGGNFRGIERRVADWAVPTLAAVGNGGAAENSVELAPDQLAWLGARGMPVHINDVHALVVLLHLGLKPEILIALGRRLRGKGPARPVSIKPCRVRFFIADAAADFLGIIRAVDFSDGDDICRALDAGGLEGAGLTSVTAEDTQIVESVGKKTRDAGIEFPGLGLVGEPSPFFRADPDFGGAGVV